MQPYIGCIFVLNFKTIKMKLKLLLTFFLISSLINAQTFVDKDATGLNDGSSWANAYTDLQTALNNDSNGSNIWIAEGVYSPGSNRTDSFVLDNSNITLFGGFNGTETQLAQRDVNLHTTELSGDVNNDDTGVAYFSVNRFENNYNVVKIDGTSCAIDGITISSGHADGNFSDSTNQGSGILINRDNFTLRNSKIIKNVVSGGGVVRMLDRQGNLNIENCTFQNNFGNSAVNIYTRASGGTLDVNITNSLFLSNTLEAASGNGDNGLLWFRQDLNFPQNVTIVNCTFARNSNITRSGGSSIIVANKTGNGSVRVQTFNSIFWDNKTAGNSAMRALGNDHPSLQNANLYQIESSISEDGLTNLTHNNTSIININNSSEDPLFKNSKEFTLQPNSIAINVGDNSKIPSGITKDLLGNTRLQADKVDLGCYETSSTIRNAPFNITYVDKNATGNNDGSSWANALTDLQTALTSADPTKEIWVAKGVYKPVLGGGGRFNRFLIDKDFTTIYGGFAGNEKSPLDRDINNNQTIISGDVNDDDTGNDFSGVNRTDNLYQLFVIDTYNVTIDGFTLTSGTADVNSGSGINPRGEGAAITVIPRNFSIPVNLVVRNSIVENNFCIRGGAIRVLDKLGTVNLENTVFRNNLATFATILYARPYVAVNGRLNTTITNCLFESNTVAKTSGIATGGIIYFRGAQVSKQFVTITNSTFVNNDNSSNGSSSANLISAQSGTDVKAFNTIFWNNKNANNQTLLTVGNDISSGVGTFTASNSLSDDTSFDVSPSTGNINSNPLFTSTTDFTLQSSSPAVNAGDNSKVPTNITSDLAGETRIFGAAVDMGAYESKVVGVIKRTLTITATDGSVSTNPNPVNGTYVDGTVVALTATPDAGYQFDGWSGDVSGTTNPVNITMDANKSVTALFSRVQRTLTITATNGSVSTNPNPINGTYDDGTLVTLTATPDAGYKLDGFRDDISGANLLRNRSNPLSTTITMDANKSITALFSKIQRTLTITASNGTVTTNPNPVNGTYDDGTVVTLTATPNAGFALVNWTIDGVTLDNPRSGPATSITVTMDADKTVSAIFDATASVNETLENSFNMYPNPALSTLNIQTAINIKSISIYDLLGKAVLKTTQKNIDVTTLNTGVYFLNIETESRQRVLKKFVKK